MELKKYQESALEILQSYLKELEKFGPKHSFISITGRRPNPEVFNDTPYICIKIPTGGGKTLVGCHAINEIMQTTLKRKLDKGVVMWFVPSEAIKTQTLKKFKDRHDWHRQVLDEAFQNNVRVFSNEEALRIRKEDVQDNLCIIVSSLDAFRKEKTLQKKYKVYQDNGSLLNHFETIEDQEYLEKEEGVVVNSLANVVRMNNPLIVIDEGHKTQTELSINFLKDLNPSFIIEYTATPRSNSNILVDIYPADLKEEQMVKIPIVLESVAQWSNAIVRGIQQLKELEKEAKRNKGEYIRPIALIQAQPKSKTQNNVTVEEVQEYLRSAKIPEEQIAVKTSERNDLEGVNLFSRKCKIRYIITVSALAEGWDCSFAYVLISVANVGSRIAVEQIIGRIIRMPNAQRKEIESLNRSYIFASARNFNEAATNIIKGLEKNGYSKQDLLGVSTQDGSSKNPMEVERSVKSDFAVPMMSLDGEKLTFEELVGEDFQLVSQNAEFDFEIHYDSDGRAIIDIQDDNQWHKGKQQILRLTYEDKNFSEHELIQWLDKKLRFTMIKKSDKVEFIEKAIKHQLEQKSLATLAVNRFLLLERLRQIITDILVKHARERLDQLITQEKISVNTYESFHKTIILKQEIPQEFNKNYYEKIDKLNQEEKSFLERLDLDSLPNIKFWIRNREKQDPFYMQGWKKNKFYPDFVAVTEKGNIIALEWKGEDRISNEDTEYKTKIGQMWTELGKDKLHFFLVHNGNAEEVLNAVKSL